MASYTIADYLMDRARIQDVVTKMYLYVDQRKFANLSTEVFADQVDVDYTHLLGGAPYVTTGQKQATGWEAQMSGYASTQHGIVGTLIDLQEPDASGPPPETAAAIANITATLVSHKGTIVKNGGRLHLGLKRTSIAAGANKWRISSITAYKGWMEGDFEPSALKQADEQPV